MGQYGLETFAEKCTGCLRCRLACSDLYTKSFNPSRSRIRVAASGTGWVLSFDEDCEGCGVCADHCFYGALEKIRKEAAP